MKIEVLENTSKKLVFELEGSDHTFCNALKAELNANKNVAVATYALSHPLIGKPKFLTQYMVKDNEGHGFRNEDRVKISGNAVGGMVELNDRIFTVADKTQDTFELADDGGASPANDIDGSGFAAWTSGGIVQLATEL